MNQDTIDHHILIIANALNNNIAINDIISCYISNNFSMADISLLLAAAKIIHGDRINGTPPEYAFNDRKTLAMIKRIK